MNIIDDIQSGKVLLSDGAWGTMLMDRGLKTNECPESWNLTNEKVIAEIAAEYVAAGADIITTNSFGATKFKLVHYSLEDRLEEINIKAASIAKKAISGNRYIFGSIGPTGKILMMGEVSEDELFEDFKIRAASLEKGGADLILIETMTAIDEAVLAVKAAKEFTNLPVACTFTFDKLLTGDYKTIMGVSAKDMLDALIGAGADIIGSNCGNGIDGMVDIVSEIRSLNRDIPVLIQANAGMPCIVNGKNVFPETPEQMTSKLKDLIENGANIVGGCCGTTPEHISSFRKLLGSI